MLPVILFGSLLIVATTLIHAVCTTLILGGLRVTHAQHWVHRNYWTRSCAISALVLVLFGASLVEAGLWAAVYFHAGVIESFSKAMYFSVVTFTTLGYGDVTLDEGAWRLLGSFEAANGTILFGWSTAVIVAGARRIYFPGQEEG